MADTKFASMQLSSDEWYFIRDCAYTIVNNPLSPKEERVLAKSVLDKLTAADVTMRDIATGNVHN